jgi:beta-lactamase class A
MKILNKKIICLIFVVALLLLYIFQTKSYQQSTCPDKYKFLNIDLNCDEDPHDRTTSLQHSIEDLVNTIILSKKASKISVFYRDLDNKQWFGVNENEPFTPSSLLKLPIAIAYYKLAEIDLDVLKRDHTYTSKDKNLFDNQTTKPKYQLEINKTYSIDELIQHMIIYSDNTSAYIISNLLDSLFLDKILFDLGIRFSNLNQIENDFLSVKTYGSILRALFNSSYLNQYYSNKLLELMSQSDFKVGIVAGVPENIKVSNKFGEKILFDQISKEIIEVELHDCGIVYVPHKPYILCIMTKGMVYDDLSSAISLISKKVYENR